MNPENQNNASVQKLVVEKKSITNYLWLFVSFLLFVALVVSVTLWKPWQPNIKAGERTISVSGEATVKAEPDEFGFNPAYDFTNKDKQVALKDLSAKNNDIVAKLKALGVADKDITNSSYGYSDGAYDAIKEDNGDFTYTLNLTISVANKDLAQKVQDYLLTTAPTGSVTPYPSFSQAKQKELQKQARNKAEIEARANANESAKNLGFKVDKVKSVNDTGFGGGDCFDGVCAVSNASNLTRSGDEKSLVLQPGENELSYSVTVVYYIH